MAQQSNVSAADVQLYLKGISYPAHKQDLIDTARDAGAPSEIMQTIEQLPQDEFGGPQDVMKAFGEEK